MWSGLKWMFVWFCNGISEVADWSVFWHFPTEALKIPLTLECNLVLSLLCLHCSVSVYIAFSLLYIHVYVHILPPHLSLSLSHTHTHTHRSGKQDGILQILNSEMTALGLSTWMLVTWVPKKSLHLFPWLFLNLLWPYVVLLERTWPCTLVLCDLKLEAPRCSHFS